jgi:hypothetical protein
VPLSTSSPTAIEIDQHPLQGHQSYAGVLVSLQEEGVTIAPKDAEPLPRARRTFTSDAGVVVAQVEQQYFSIHNNDEVIADTLNAQELHAKC